jgi:hypothetical protein
MDTTIFMTGIKMTKLIYCHGCSLLEDGER